MSDNSSIVSELRAAWDLYAIAQQRLELDLMRHTITSTESTVEQTTTWDTDLWSNYMEKMRFQIMKTSLKKTATIKRSRDAR